jgi:hypothetical protein
MSKAQLHIAILIVAGLSVETAAAQSAAPSAAAPASQATPITVAADDTKPAPPRKGRWLKADARVCLEFPTAMQVIKCSEKYR